MLSRMGGDFQFNLDTEKLESVQSLLARNAPILDLLQNKVLKAQITRGTLVLEDGSATLFALKGLLKAHGCKFDAETKTWRRSSATVAERYAVGVLKAREATSNAQKVNEKNITPSNISSRLEKVHQTIIGQQHLLRNTRTSFYRMLVMKISLPSIRMYFSMSSTKDSGWLGEGTL